MPMAKITPVGESGLYHVHFLDRTDPGFGGGLGGGADPGFDRPIHHPGHPDHGLPSSPGHPSQPIHHPGHPDHGLPSQPGHPANRPPGSGNPVFPDNSLPTTPPPQVKPGETLVLVRGPDGKWKYAAVPPGAVPKPIEPPAPQPKPA